MASYIETEDYGSYASIEALWAAHPEGGVEGAYCTINGVKYRWDKYDRMWVADPNYGPTPARKVDTFNGDVNIQNNLTVAGTIRAKGINNPCVGYFASEEALEEKWPYPKVGWWAIVGETIPGTIYSCNAEGEWTNTGHTGGSGEVELAEYAKLTDLPEIIDNLNSERGDKVLSAKQGKILNDKFPGAFNEMREILEEELNQAVESIIPIKVEGDVNNAPDEEDLTSENNGSTDVLKFKDKAYSSLIYSGLGRKYLRKNMVNGVNKLTQAMFRDSGNNDLENTIFHIQYDYDLDGATITMPAGATLKFEGGSLKNGTITGNGTAIDAGNTKIFDSVTFSGSFKGSLNALWVGAKSKDSTFDNTPILQAWLDNYSDYFRVIEFPLDSYYFLTPCVKNDTDRFKEIRGNNSNFYVNIADDGDKGQYFLTIKGENFTLKDLRIVNVRKTTVGSTNYDLTKTRCLYLNQAQLFSISGTTIMYFDVAVHIDDVWYGGFSGVNALMSNRIGVLALNSTSYEVNTIDFRNIRLRGVSAEFCQAVWVQESGESDADYAMRIASVGLDFHCITNNCKFDAVTMEMFDYGIRFSYAERSGSNGSLVGVASIAKCYFEANRVYDIYTGQGYVIRAHGYTYSLRNHMKLLIESCLFHSLKQLYFTDADVTMLSCHEACTATLGVGYTGVSMVHDGCVNSNSEYSTRIHPDKQFWTFNTSNNESTHGADFDTLRGKLESYNSERGIIAPYTESYRLSQKFNQSTRWYNVGNVIRRSFEMYPSVGFQDIILPVRCEYNAQKNAMRVEVMSGGSKRFASADYRSAMRVVGSTNSEDNGGIPLFDFLLRWDAGKSYTGKVSHLFPFSITANPTTGLITSGASVVGVGKNAYINGALPSNDYIDVDSMCSVVLSDSYYKVHADLIQCGRTYDEVLPTINTSVNARNRRAYGSSANRANKAPSINAIYFNTDTNKYEIYNGTKWVNLTNRYQRYEFAEHGASLADRPTMADFPGQTFTDDSTGITYVFWVNATHTSWGWKSINNNVGATADRPSLDWGANGYQFYDTTIKRNIYSKMGKSVEKTETVGAGSQSTATVKTVENTLTEGRKYWVGYSTKQSWGGKVSFRRTADSSAGEITILSNFNDNAKGTYFTAPSTTDFPYIYMSNNYSAAETVTFEVPATSWIEDDGATAGVARSGDTASRPASTDIYVGFQYFDTDEGKYICWNGTAWVNLDGSALS